MAKQPRKTPANDASKSLKETERRIRAAEKQIAKTGRLRNPSNGAFLKVNKRNIAKVQRELVKDVKQSKRTLKAASKFASTIADLFKEKKNASQKNTKKKAQNNVRKSAGAKSQVTHTVIRDTSTKVRERVASPTPVELPDQLTRKRAYQASELPQSFHSRVFNTTLENLERDAKEYDKKFLTNAGDMWGYKIGYRNQRGHWVGGYSTSTFGSFRQMIQHIHGYGSGGGAKKGGAFDPNLYNSPSLNDTQATLFHIVRFNAQLTPKSKRQTWGEQRKEFNLKREKSKREYGEKKKAQEKVAFERSLMRAEARAEERITKRVRKETEKKIKELEAKIARLERGKQ